MAIDPRFLPGWDPQWWERNHPLGLMRSAYVSVVTRDLERAKSVWLGTLGGTLLYENESSLTGTKNAYVIINRDLVVELAQPLQSHSLAASDLAENGEIVHAVAWRVRDLAQAESHLKANGVTILETDGTTFLTDPGDTFGAALRFTTWVVPNDPRG